MSELRPEKIKSLRLSRGFSQKSIAKLLGVTDRAVSKWETGLSQPSAQNMIALAKILNVSIDDLVSNKEPSFSQKRVGMESLSELYKIGRGPSSSHTNGPEKACQIFKKRNPDATAFKVTLYGSLAKTGKGHGTEQVILKTFMPIPCSVEFNLVKTDLPHPNTMTLSALKSGKLIDTARVFSIGGGSIEFENSEIVQPPRPYKLDTFKDIFDYCLQKNIHLWQYAEENEESSFHIHMENVWKTMKKSIQSGILDEGILPGGLGVHKKAKMLYNSQHIDETPETRENRIVCSYAFAVSEQNASGETIVTAPTCGAAGVLPSVLYYQQQKHNFTDTQILHALETAGIIGNLIKTNASISGAECGCQVEIGSACAMAAAALAELFGLNLDKIEYAAEIAIEHHLGLTCDPICGLVQIPCIERNAVAAMRAINAVSLASFLFDTRKISLDKVINAMKETGQDMHSAYKETSEAGLARIEIK